MDDGLVGMLELYFDMLYEGTVNPFLGGGAAGLADDGAEIMLCEAHLIGIETDLVFGRGVLVDEIDKTVEDGLFS